MHSRNLSVIAMTIANSLIQLLGVLAWGWPIGNIFLLLWIENVIITLIAIGRVMSVTMVPGKDIGGSKLAITFTMAIFCFVHGVFSVVLAFMTGLDLTPFYFMFPLVVLVVRYSVEGVGWLVRGQRPDTIAQAHGFAMRRIIMLHFVIIACWFVMVFGLIATPLWGVRLPMSPALLALVILLIIKTWGEVASLRSDANAASTRQFSSR